MAAFHVGKFYDIWAPKSAFLAVDLFFCLSGFVLARTYDPRFAAGMTAGQFLRARAIRLYPMYALGLALGAVALVHTLWIGGIGKAGFLSAIFFNAFLLPTPIYGPGWSLFPVDQVAWSLFGEFWIANLAFALFWRQLHDRVLATVVGLSLCALVAFAFRFHGLEVGSTWLDCGGGIARVCFSFFAGVALFRGWHSRPSIGRPPSWLICLISVAALSIPRWFGAPTDILCVAVVFPCLIYFGAGAKERRPWLGAVTGELSYALYVLHLPALFLVHAAVPPGRGMDLGVALTFLLAIILVSYQVHHRYDPSARKMLRDIFRL